MTGGKFKLPKGYRECLDGAREEASKYGVAVDYRISGQHHPKLIFSYGEREMIVPFSCTPRVNMQAEFGKRKARSAARTLCSGEEIPRLSHPTTDSEVGR